MKKVLAIFIVTALAALCFMVACKNDDAVTKAIEDDVFIVYEEVQND